MAMETQNKLAVISCIWNRPERLEYTLRQLSQQTFRDFTVFLINNNPDLYQMVEDKIFDFREESEIWFWLIQNLENRGPYSRLEWMVRLKDSFDFFVTVDDDACFPPSFLATWWVQRDVKEVQGWNGFKFKPGGTYWQRDQVEAGEEADYLWGSSMLVPSSAIDYGLLGLDKRYWKFADDLWLCYYANHVKGLTLRKASFHPGIFILEDGKDVYHMYHQEKTDLLTELRCKGWKV